jgi:hypothetical protein
LIYAWLCTKPYFLLLEIWSGLVFMLLGLGLNVLHVFYFVCVWYVFLKEFFSFYVFVMLNLFWFWVLVLGLCFGLLSGQPIQVNLFGLTMSRQPTRGNPVRSVIGPVWFVTCFCFLWLMVVFDKHLLYLFWLVLFKEICFFFLVKYSLAKKYKK